MKKLLSFKTTLLFLIMFLFLLIFTTYSFCAGEPGDIVWDRIYDRNDIDVATSLIQTNDGGYAVGGATFSQDGNKSDFWIIKLDNNGNKLWDKIYDRSDIDVATSLIQTNDGGYAVGGATSSKFSQFPQGVGNSDFWIIKLDNNGNKLWDKIYDKSVVDVATSLTQTNDGGYAVGGGTLFFSTGNSDFWVIKVQGDIHRSGSINLNSIPSSQIYLNNQSKGATPLTLDNLTPGAYQLKLSQEGYQDYTQEVQIKAGETTQITASLSLVPKKEEPTETTAYQQFFQQGKNYYTGGLYPEAVQSFRKALSIDDTGWELHYYLGKTYQELEIYNPAIDCYKKAIGIKPQEYEPYFSLGNVYDHVKLYQEAIIAYEKACRINSESDLLYTCLGLAYHHADIISEAIKSHNKAIELNPVNTASFSYLADIYFEKGLYSLAITNYQKSIHINPNNEQLHYKLGKTYYEAGQYPEAVSYLDQAIRINPTYARAYHLLGLTYVALGDNISANKQYEILKKLDDSLAKKLKELIGK